MFLRMNRTLLQLSYENSGCLVYIKVSLFMDFSMYATLHLNIVINSNAMSCMHYIIFFTFKR